MKKRARSFTSLKRQLGQGMSEYIIITALIALSAIGVVSAFGGVIQQQFGSMAHSMAGEDATEVNSNGADDTDNADLGSWQDKSDGAGGN